MTETTVALSGVLILAVLGVIVKVLDYTNKQIMPQITILIENVNALKTAHALNQQEIQQNTARLNGQSSKIDNLMLAAPPTPASAPALPGPASVTIVNTAEPASSPESAAAEVTPPPGPSDMPKQSNGIVSDVIKLVTGLGKPDAPDDAPEAEAPTNAPQPAAETQPEAPPAPATVNVTITTDHALSADELKAAHDALDAQARATGGGQ